METKLLYVTALMILYCIQSTNCCFIRNCPPGGKRSMDVSPLATHECLRCGPGLSGQCVGPKTCCGEFGCLMGTVDTDSCNKEDESKEPCAVRGEPCGSFEEGTCVATGICCDSYACSYNNKCKVNTNRKGSQELVSLLNKLLLQSDEFK